MFCSFKHFLLQSLLRMSPHALCEWIPFEMSGLFFPAHLRLTSQESGRDNENKGGQHAQSKE